MCSLGLDWKRTHKPTLKIISGLLAVRYSNGPIMPLYSFSSTEGLLSSITNLVEGDTGVSIGLDESIPNFLSSSFTYFCWWTKVPFEVCLIYKPKRKLSSSIMLISNSLLIIFEKSLQRFSCVAPKIISSTYTWTTVSYTHLTLPTNREV